MSVAINQFGLLFWAHSATMLDSLPKFATRSITADSSLLGESNTWFLVVQDCLSLLHVCVCVCECVRMCSGRVAVASVRPLMLHRSLLCFNNSSRA